VLEMRGYAQRPVLVVELGAEARRARVDYHRVVAAGGEQLRVTSLERAQVGMVVGFQELRVHASSVHLRGRSCSGVPSQREVADTFDEANERHTT
jgi:hypothetical protein